MLAAPNPRHPPKRLTEARRLCDCCSRAGARPDGADTVRALRPGLRPMPVVQYAFGVASWFPRQYSQIPRHDVIPNILVPPRHRLDSEQLMAALPSNGAHALPGLFVFQETR